MSTIDDDPKLQPDDGWFEVGWIAAKMFMNPEEPDVVMMKWQTDGLDHYRQVGMIDSVKDHLRDLRAGE